MLTRAIFIVMIVLVGSVFVSQLNITSDGKDTQGDVYSIEDSGAWHLRSGSKMKAAMFMEAVEFCWQKGKDMEKISERPSASCKGQACDFDQAEIRFRCR